MTLPNKTITIIVCAAIITFLTTCGNKKTVKPVEEASGTNDLPQYPGELLDRSRIENQDVDPTNLVTKLIYPTLGNPLRIDLPAQLKKIKEGEKKQFPELEVVLYTAEEDTPEQWIYRLVPRKELTFLDEENPYVIPLSRKAKEDEDLFPKNEYKKLRKDSEESIRERIASFNIKTKELAIKKGISIPLIKKAKTLKEIKKFSKGTIYTQQLQVRQEMPESLFALVILDKNNNLIDVQYNAVYSIKNPSPDFNFIVAGDIQWGELHSVAKGTLMFVRRMNRIKEKESIKRSPQTDIEFILLVGDVVDCQYGSAGSILKKLFGGAADYPHNYLQAWMALVGLHVPIYTIPGNHDGYRFVDSVGDPDSDGLLLYESTFGPLYYSFKRGPFKFFMLNSYDLPAHYRTASHTGSSSLLESFADKLNVMNWGGGMRKPQKEWLRKQLKKAKKAALTPVVGIHHDPRGSYPSIDPDKYKLSWKFKNWDYSRKFPVTARSYQRRIALNPRTPGFEHTTEIHAGFYTPVREADSEIRSADWFARKLDPTPPPSTGYPGWSKYQQEWHSNYIYTGSLKSSGSFKKDRASKIVHPLGVLVPLVQYEVHAIFKGHDNRFCKTVIEPGDNILQDTRQQLERYGRNSRKTLDKLNVTKEMTVYHTADVSDAESDGHGYLLVTAKNGKLKATEAFLDSYE
ncbi:MAG: hypothetical protein GY754_03400 [bacterium]|nr:hypothetical protein [bacterium]